MNKIKSLYKFLSPKHQSLFLEYKTRFKPRYGHGLPPHAELYDQINQNRDQYSDLLTEFLKFRAQLITIEPEMKKNSVEPYWNNGFLPGLDIIGLYALIALKKPKKYIEIGSGNSTKVAFKAKTDFNLDFEIISVDPFPRAEIDDLANKVIRKPLENINIDFILQLEEGDMLFVDNSHRILPNSDSMVFYLEILPHLKKGVVVQIHDIYLPYDYPQFMCDRFYSEQYGLAMYLLANSSKFHTLLPNYFISEDQELSSIISPFWQYKNMEGVEKHGGSFWFQIRE